MPEADPHAGLIARLSADLRPVRPLPPGWLRAIVWSAAIMVLAVLVQVAAPFGPLPDSLEFGRIASVALPAATAFLSAWAAFETGRPGASRRWALLPVPALAAWVASSAAGCLGHLLSPASLPVAGPPPQECFSFLLCASLPLVGLMVLMLRRSLPLRPGLTLTLGALAAAGGAASLLGLHHPADTSLLDLLMHGLAVLVVLAAVKLLGARALESASGGTA